MQLLLWLLLSNPVLLLWLQARVRWLKVLQAAQEPKGGSWQPNFSADCECSCVFALGDVWATKH